MVTVAGKKVAKVEKAPTPSVQSQCTTLSNAIVQPLSQNQTIALNLYFSITDRNETSNDTLTGLHVITLLLLASEFPAVIDMCQNYSMKMGKVAIVSDTDRTREEFCSGSDQMYQTSTGIIRRRILPDGEVDYVVDVHELQTTYMMGDYTYLFIVSTMTPQQQKISEEAVSIC